MRIAMEGADADAGRGESGRRDINDGLSVRVRRMGMSIDWGHPNRFSWSKWDQSVWSIRTDSRDHSSRDP